MNPSTKTLKAAGKALTAAAAENPVPNSVWSNNNTACVNTWFCLSREVLGQLDASFEEAETKTMADLVFYNHLAPGNNLDAEASALADVLTKLFINVLGAAYEPGQNYASAVEAMRATLVVRDNTVCALAAVVDELHHFNPEN